MHNRKVMDLRRIAAFAVLAVLFAAPCSGVCTGWERSTDARMACCVGKSADEATMCCASSESRQNAESPAVLAIVASGRRFEVDQLTDPDVALEAMASA